MKTANAVAKNYGLLSPEERFRLILAASARDDNAERDRLARTGERLVLSMTDFAPYAHALTVLCFLTYIELLEEAARYLDAVERANDMHEGCGDEKEQTEKDGGEAEGNQADDAEAGAWAKEDASAWTVWERALDIALAAGYMLRAKADGWKLFCGRLKITPSLLWGTLPGFDRLERALKLTETLAFAPEGFLRWLNAVRPDGEPEVTEVGLTAELVADATEKMFREHVEWWGADE